MIKALYGKGKSAGSEGALTGAKPSKLLSQLEQHLDASKNDWSLPLLRDLWNELKVGITRRGRSLAHEVSWLSAAGFCLRPGFGFEQDDIRINELWRLFDLGLSHKKVARAQIQWWILWRRVSPGLNAERQEKLFEQALKTANNKSEGYIEAYRLLGSLEHVSIEKRTALAESLVREFKRAKMRDALCWTFGRLTNRELLYSQKSEVISVIKIEQWIDLLSDVNWSSELCRAFLLAGRCSKNKKQNISEKSKITLRNKLLESGSTKDELRVLIEYIQIEVTEQKHIFGESLPLGLSF